MCIISYTRKKPFKNMWNTKYLRIRFSNEMVIWVLEGGKCNNVY